MNANEGTLTELYAFSMAISCLIYKGIYMTIEDVLFIKQCKEDGKYSKAEIYQLYEDVMTMNGFSSIWYNYSYEAIQPIKNPDRPKKVDHRYCKLNVTTIRDECSGVELG